MKRANSKRKGKIQFDKRGSERIGNKYINIDRIYKNMNIYDLAFTTLVYGSLTDFNKTYIKLINDTNNNININLQSHRQTILKWLNDWGCRNFYKDYHELASKELYDWHTEYSSLLPQKKINIWELSFEDLELIEKSYNSLTIKIASYAKRKNGKVTPNKFGPTGTSKILFALRPKSLIPWDGEMRKEFKKKYKISTYKQFMSKVIKEVRELKTSCQKNGFELEDIPAKLNKSNNITIPKLIDEYHWITITNKCNPPDNKTLETWLKWNS